ncbi:MAG: WecB/TagA/CpsF family glycosyltransferase [Burkholderiaceae bacterium]
MTSATAPERDLMDFRRGVYCVLGLPFDAGGTDVVLAHLRSAARTRTRCVLTTPNINFIAAAMRNERFRDDVLKSDLCVPDGMPIIWLARLLRIPLRARVSGADLFDRLIQPGPYEPMRVFLFGGEDGVAARAHRWINERAGGVLCVGDIEPAVGSVETLSDPALIARINATRSDFLILSLGAEKAQAWIERNRAALQPPIVSHLGAVLKFTAGTIRRAPRWMSSIGLEWIWRMKEEPFLWRRYFDDGRAVLGVLWRRQLPAMLRAAWSRPGHEPPRIDVETRADVRIIRLRGTWREADLPPLREAFEQVATSRSRVGLDLSAVSYMDSAAIGLLLLLRGHCLRHELTMQIIGISDELTRWFHFHCVDYLLDTMESIAPITRVNPAPLAEGRAAVPGGAGNTAVGSYDEGATVGDATALPAAAQTPAEASARGSLSSGRLSTH